MTTSYCAAKRGWTVVLAALGINLILGVLYAWGVMGKALAAQWGSAAQASLPFTVSTATFALTMIFAGRCQDILGPRYVAMLGGLILGCGLVASSFVSTPVALAVTFGFVGGIGIGVGYSATTPPAIKWFPPARKGMITGIVVSGVGLAAVYMAPLTSCLIHNTSVARTFLILGVGTIVLVSLLAQLLANPPQGYAPAGAVPGPVAGRAAPHRLELDWREMLGSGQFYHLWAMFVLSASAGLMVIMHVAIIAKEQAHVAWGFWLIAILALCNTAGRLLSGWLSDRIGRAKTMLLAFVLQAFNMFAFSHYTTPELMIFGAALTGLCYGTIFTLFPATTADFYGLRNLGVNYGLMFTAFGVAGVTGPFIAGYLHDRFGSYAHAYTLCALMLLVGAVLSLLLRAPKTGPASPAPLVQAPKAAELAPK